MRAGVVLLVAAGLAGCAAGYSRTMGQSLGRVQSRDWEGALASLDKPSGDTNMLLYRLEKGPDPPLRRRLHRLQRPVREGREAHRPALHALHQPRGGGPAHQRRHPRLLGRGVRARPHPLLPGPELPLSRRPPGRPRRVPQGEPASLRLRRSRRVRAELRQRRLHAVPSPACSTRPGARSTTPTSPTATAAKGYAAYEDAFGLAPPPPLAADLRRATAELGFEPEWDGAAAALGPRSRGLRGAALGPGTVTVFAETGFVGRKGHRTRSTCRSPRAESSRRSGRSPTAPCGSTITGGRARWSTGCGWPCRCTSPPPARSPACRLRAGDARGPRLAGGGPRRHRRAHPARQGGRHPAAHGGPGRGQVAGHGGRRGGERGPRGP